jgi:hypothetical protein
MSGGTIAEQMLLLMEPEPGPGNQTFNESVSDMRATSDAVSVLAVLNNLLQETATAADTVSASTAPAFTFQGALANNTVDAISANYTGGVTLTWSGETYDTDASHDTGSSTGRLTIQSALNGKYGIIHGQAYLHNTDNPGDILIYISKNGSPDFVGRGIQCSKKTFTADSFAQTKSAPILLSTGDFYEISIIANDSSAVLEQEYGYIALEVVG